VQDDYEWNTNGLQTERDKPMNGTWKADEQIVRHPWMRYRRWADGVWAALIQTRGMTVFLIIYGDYELCTQTFLYLCRHQPLRKSGRKEIQWV